MKLNDSEKLKYINDRFHQYFDLKLNTNITTKETVNLVLKIQDLFDLGDSLSTSTNYHHDISIDNDFDISTILEEDKYNDTDISKELRAVCTRVIDGDTIKVDIINSDGDNVIKTSDTVRLIGVNTPEKGLQGYESSKKFVEKACYFNKYFDKLKCEFKTNEEYLNKITSKDLEVLCDVPTTWQFVLTKNSDKQVKIYDNINLTENSATKTLNFSSLNFYNDDVTYTIKVIIKNKEIQIYINEKLNTTILSDNSYEKDKALLYTKGEDVKIWYDEIINNKQIYLNIDSVKERDSYGRLLGVVIVNNKNLNEVLIKEKLAEVYYVPPCEFNPNDWKEQWSSVGLFNYKNDDIALLSQYFRPDMKNIVFTPSGDTNTLYRHEVYKGVIYLKMNPFSEYIRMHILPKAYDCTNNVLLFRDEDSNFNQVISKSNDYKVYNDRDNINAYFQENGVDRDRDLISNKNYNINNWEEESSLDASKTFCDFSYNISKSTESLNNLQICAGYRYNHTSPYYALHYTGVKDNTGKPEDRCTLIDANIDGIKGDNSNVITQMSYVDPDSSTAEDDIVYIKHDVKVKKEIGNNDHISEIGKVHHKILKYINDLLYVEEGDAYGSKMWFDPFLTIEHKVEIQEPNKIKFKGTSEHAGKITIYIDKDTQNSFSKEVLTNDFGNFKTDFFEYTPGEHSYFIKYTDPNSIYPESETPVQTLSINKIPLNVSATGVLDELAQKININVKVLDFYNRPVKNKKLNFVFKPGEYSIIFRGFYHVNAEDYNLASFEATTNENGEISLTKEYSQIIIDNSISPTLEDTVGFLGAYELYIEFPSDEKYILQNKVIPGDMFKDFGKIHLIQK